METSDKLGEYSIGQVARLSNLSTHTIRAWERRYGVVTPYRSGGGTRRYSAADLQRLQLLKAAVESGHRISDLAELDNDAILERAGLSRRDKPRPNRASENRPLTEVDPRSVAEIIAQAGQLKGRAVRASLEVQFRVFGAAAFRTEFCGVLLRTVGELWAVGDLSMGAEHLISAEIKRLLSRAVDGHRPVENAPKVIFTTPDEEQHELGLLIAAGVASDAGADVINLGPSLPPDAVASAAEKVGAFAIALSFINIAPGSQRTYLCRLRALLPEGTQVWLGGASADVRVPGCDMLSLDDMDSRIREHVARLQ